MLFYRSAASHTGSGPSLQTLRVLTLISLSAYPTGGMLLALGPTEKAACSCSPLSDWP